jgi:pSer/pThr/pTyr-binding forkhead associated (FHA) protein
MSDTHRKLVVGRARDCDILLTHESVSRRHAELALDGDGGFSVRDLESAGGTFVARGDREIPVHQTKLKKTDTLRLGDYEITVADLLALVPPEKPPAPPAPPPKPRMMRCACGTIKERGKPCPDCGA